MNLAAGSVYSFEGLVPDNKPIVLLQGKRCFQLAINHKSRIPNVKGFA